MATAAELTPHFFLQSPPDTRAKSRYGRKKFIEPEPYAPLWYKAFVLPSRWALPLIETPGVPLSYRVEDKMRLAKGKERLTVNRSLTLAGLPPEAFHYRLGNRSALDWAIVQH